MIQLPVGRHEGGWLTKTAGCRSGHSAAARATRAGWWVVAGGLATAGAAAAGHTAGGAAAGGPAAGGLAAGGAAAGLAAAGATAAGTPTAGPAAARDAAAGPAAAGTTAAGAAASGPAAGGLAAAGAATSLLATALVRADGATTRVDHGVRGWRFWDGFQESRGLSLMSPRAMASYILPVHGELSTHLPCVCLPNIN